MNFTRVTQEEREQLYEEVWAEPVTTVAARYNLSDNGLRKHLKKLWIPLPPRGYWEKVRAGKNVAKTRLPAVHDELKNHVYAYAIKYKVLDQMADSELEGAEGLSLFTEETVSYIQEKCVSIEVKDQLRNPHHLISKHKEEYAHRKKRDKELKKAEFNQGYYNTIKSKYRENQASLPISASVGNLNRCYRILDALFKTLDPMEGSVRVGLSSGQDVGHLRIPHSSFIFEVKEEKRKAGKPLLVLSMHTTEWCYGRNIRFDLEYRDSAAKPLENQVGDIVLEMFVTAAKVRAQDILGHREWDQKIEEDEYRSHLENMRKGEVAELQILEQGATDWDRAEKIRRFASAVEVAIEGVANSDDKEKLLSWLKWVNGKADWLDPLTEKEDELLAKSKHLFDRILGR